MSLRSLMHRSRPSEIDIQRNRDPFHTLQDEMNRLFGSFTGDYNFPALWGENENRMFPSIDVTENEKTYSVTAELPGIDSDDVELSIEGQQLTIKGEKKEEKEEKEDNFIRRERSYGSFQRAVLLPDTADLDKAEADFSKGVLSVTIPKKKDAASKARKVEIKQSA